MKKLLIGLALLLSLAACTSVNQTGTMQVGPDESKQIIESNSQWRAKLHISDMKAGYAGNLMRAQAKILNKSGSTQSFQYKFKWFDKSGFEVAVDGRPWTPMTITGHESKAVQALAPNPSVAYYKVLVQN